MEFIYFTDNAMVDDKQWGIKDINLSRRDRGKAKYKALVVFDKIDQHYH